MPLPVNTQFPSGGDLTAANLNAPANSLRTNIDTVLDALGTTYLALSAVDTVATPNTVVKRLSGGGANFAGGVTAVIGTFSGLLTASAGIALVGQLAAAPNAAVVPIAIAGGSSFSAAPFTYAKAGGGSMSINNDASVSAPTFLALPAAANVGVAVVGAASQSAPYVNMIDSASATVFVIAANKAAVFGGVVTAAGFVGPLVDLSVTGAKVAERTLPWSKVASLAYSATGASNTVTVVADGLFVNTAGILKTVTAGTAKALTPSGSGPEWQAVYADDSAVLQVATGTVSGARDTAVIPTSGAFQPIWVYLPTSCTGIYSSNADWVAAGSPAAKGYIEQRPLPGGGAGGAGGGTTDSAVRSDAHVLLNGASAVHTGGADVTANVAGLAIYPTNVRRTATSASVDDIQQAWLQPDVAQRLSKSSTTTVLLSASSGQPLAIRDRKITASSTATASGSAGARYAVLDTGTGQLVTPMPTTPSPTVTGAAVMLAVWWWDGTVLQDSTFYDLSGLGTVPSSSMNMVSVPLNDTGVASSALATTSAWTAVPNVTPVTFYVPVACKCRIQGRFIVSYVAAGTGPTLLMALGVDGTTSDLADIGPVVGTEIRTLPIFPISTMHNLAPGSHTFGAWYFSLAGVGSTVQILANGCQAMLDIYKA